MSAPEEEFDFDESIYHVPKQKTRSQASMGNEISTYPPLDRVTQLQSGTVSFIAVLHVPGDHVQQPWEVALWSQADDSEGDWTETILSRTKRVPSTLQKVAKPEARVWFDGKVTVKSSLHFTVKYRTSPDSPWQWVRDEQNKGNGLVIVNSQTTTDAISEDFGSILKGHDSNLVVKSCTSQCPATRLWSITATVPAAKGENSAYADAKLGLPWGGFLR